MDAPKAKKIVKDLTQHNHTRQDEFYWLRERENPEVISYLEQENKYLDEQMKPVEQFREDLFKELVARIKQNDMSVPSRLRNYYYYNRFEKGQEYPVFCRKKGNLDADEEIILDCNELAKGHSFFQIGGVSVSHDNMRLAFSVDNIGRRKYNIKIKDLATGEISDQEIENTSGEVSWANDNKSIFFVRKDEETLRPYQVYRCCFDNQFHDETLVYEDLDETFYVSVGKSKSEQFIVIHSESTVSSEVWVLDAYDPTGEFKVITPREKDLEYTVAHFEDKFYIKTNLDAKNFCIMETSIHNPSKENWKILIPHRDDVLLETYSVFNDYLVLDERIKGLHCLRILSWDKTLDYYISMPEETYTAYMGLNADFDSTKLRYGYTSMTTPTSIIEFDMKTKKKKLLKQYEVEGKYNSDDYSAERLFAKAKDGAEIPISIVYKKGLKKDGSHPCLIYGYGSYGSSLDPFFSPSRLSLLDRGFSFAIAHIRGGEEMGRRWYEEGKLLKKKNTFTDFISCSEFLIKEGFTSSQHLYASGGSAGGLLMGAVLNMAPQLYNGVAASVPFVDVVTTMLDETIPLTTGEYDEWGNPNVKEYYDYMLSYSPYDNVDKKDYPSILVTTGLHDSQVQYWEPAKWVARLRDRKTDKNLLLMHCDMEVGHGGASGRFKQFKDTALEFAFYFMLEGIKK
ncbi:MAG: S9 family peptidase [Bacteroidales bacterium]